LGLFRALHRSRAGGFCAPPASDTVGRSISLGTMGASAAAPALYGLTGDALGAPIALVIVSVVCVLAMPLMLALRLTPPMRT
jgi:hypothetical protein